MITIISAKKQNFTLNKIEDLRRYYIKGGNYASITLNDETNVSAFCYFDKFKMTYSVPNSVDQFIVFNNIQQLKKYVKRLNRLASNI